MKNVRGEGARVLVSASAARSSGVPCIEEGFFGFPVKDIASGESGWLDISQREFEVTISSGQTWAKGTLIYLTSGGGLTSTASGNTKVGKVTRVNADGGPKSGKVYMLTLPQQA